MEKPSVGLSLRLEPLSDAGESALMDDTAQDAAGETEPAEKPDTDITRGHRIGWWW